MCITLNLEKVYYPYLQYNTHFYNRIINMVCLLCILFSMFVLLNYIPLELNITKYVEHFVGPNLRCVCSVHVNCIVYILYFIYYIYLANLLGLIANIFYLGLLLLSNFFYCKIEYAYIYAIIINISAFFCVYLTNTYSDNRYILNKGLFNFIFRTPICIVLDILKCIPGISSFINITSDNISNITLDTTKPPIRSVFFDELYQNMIFMDDDGNYYMSDNESYY